jgi:hypothetical protein
LQDPNCEVAVSEEFMRFGTGLVVGAVEYLFTRPAPEFGMTEEDASFVSLKPADGGGWSFACLDRWELWSV